MTQNLTRTHTLRIYHQMLAILAAVQKGNYFLIPLNFTVCVGFGMILFWSWREIRGNEQAT